MMNVEWKYKSVQEMTAPLTAREISACELAEAAIARIESLNPKLNDVCVHDFDRARRSIASNHLNLATVLAITKTLHFSIVPPNVPRSVAAVSLVARSAANWETGSNWRGVLPLRHVSREFQAALHEG